MVYIDIYSNYKATLTNSKILLNIRAIKKRVFRVLIFMGIGFLFFVLFFLMIDVVSMKISLTFAIIMTSLMLFAMFEMLIMNQRDIKDLVNYHSEISFTDDEKKAEVCY